MLDPKMEQLCENRLGFLWERGNEMATSDAGTVSNWPRGIFEAVEESTEHWCYEWLEWFFIYFCGYLCA